jgi:hypothetical protein
MLSPESRSPTQFYPQGFPIKTLHSFIVSAIGVTWDGCPSQPPESDYPNTIWSHVEAGYNTSTAALRVVEGDEKRTQCLGI